MRPPLPAMYSRQAKYGGKMKPAPKNGRCIILKTACIVIDGKTFTVTATIKMAYNPRNRLCRSTQPLMRQSVAGIILDSATTCWFDCSDWARQLHYKKSLDAERFGTLI